jgi:hypothetical protein
MQEKSTTITASTGLLIGGILGMAGSFASSASLRSLAWGLDGIGLIIAGALLVIYYFRKGEDTTAAGFLIFILGEALILSSSGIDLDANVPSFGAGTALWAASLALISFQKVFPLFVRSTGFVAAVLFAFVAVQIFTGHPLNALTKTAAFFRLSFFCRDNFWLGLETC